MKGLKKALVIGGAIGVLSSPLMALEVYNEDDKKLELYGSIRAYIGGAGYGQDHSSGGNALYGLQTNSHLGVKTTIGKFSAKAELGAAEKGIASSSSDAPGFRHLWGEYDFGKGGKLLLGKTDAPSMPDGFFVSNVIDTDQGAAGYGALRTANRKVQIRYTIAGLAIALVEDTLGSGKAENDAVPRVALGWSHKANGLNVKIGGAYKYYNFKGTTHTDGNKSRASDSAFHVFAAVKKEGRRNYFSSMIHYGMNADLYDEQRTQYNLGTYAHKAFEGINNANTHRAGAYAEGGLGISEKLKAVLGLGYQATWVTQANFGLINTYTVTIQLPYKLDKHVTITPQISWYAYASSKINADAKIDITGYDNNSVVGVVRFAYAF